MVKQNKYNQYYLDNTLSYLLTTTVVDGEIVNHDEFNTPIEDLVDKPLKAVGTVRDGVIRIYTKENKNATV